MVVLQLSVNSARMIGCCPCPTQERWAVGRSMVRAGEAPSGSRSLSSGRIIQSRGWKERPRRERQQQMALLQAQNGALQTETLSDNGSAPRGISSSVGSADDLSSEAEAQVSVLVFEDEAEGICCYRTPSGEVTCEGHDEGPYFSPGDRCNDRTRKSEASSCASSPKPEVAVYKCVKGRHGEAWCEGKDES